MKVPCLLVVLAVSCGGATEDPEATPPRATAATVVLRGRLEGATTDCGISGPSSCFQGTLAREVWLLSRTDSMRCHKEFPTWCSVSDRRPLAQVVASTEGKFTLSATEGPYRLAVVYHDSLRPAWREAAGGLGVDDGGFVLTTSAFPAEALFHFAADPP